MLEQATIPFIAFELRLDRIAEAKKEKRKVYHGDVTDPPLSIICRRASGAGS